MKTREKSALELVGAAGEALGIDQSIEKKIADKFNAFEIDSESD